MNHELNIDNEKTFDEKLTEMLDSVGINMREWRIKKGYSMETLGNMAHLSRQTITKYENNTVTPSLRNLLQVCIAMDCSLDCLTNNLGYSNHDLKFICEYTGLSEESVSLLHAYAKSGTHLDMLNRLILDSIADNPNSILTLLERYSNPQQERLYLDLMGETVTKTVYDINDPFNMNKVTAGTLTDNRLDSSSAPGADIEVKARIGDIAITKEVFKNGILDLIGKRLDELLNADDFGTAAKSKKKK